MGLLGWAVTAAIVAIVAGIMGFTGVASGAATVARLLFGVFLVVALLLFAFSLFGLA
jgi:uncharacterized membrane protein YtjA (UPF0391 family)